MPGRDDSLDAEIRSRSRSENTAVDALNSTVPKADPHRRDVLEQRLMAHLQDESRPEGKNQMTYVSVLGRTTKPFSRPYNFAVSPLLLVMVSILCAVAVFIGSNPPPDRSLPVAAPVNQDQQAATPTATPFAATVVPNASESANASLTADAMDTSAASATATPFPLMTATPTSTLYQNNETSPTVVPPATVPPVPTLDMMGAALSSASMSASIDGERLVSLNDVQYTVASTLKLYIALALPAEDSSISQGDFETAYTEVTTAPIKILYQSGMLTLDVSPQAWMVLNWYLSNTNGDLYYEVVE